MWYWDFTTALRFTFEEYWWHSFVIGIGGGLYMEELKCERALASLTSASYYWRPLQSCISSDWT